MEKRRRERAQDERRRARTSAAVAVVVSILVLRVGAGCTHHDGPQPEPRPASLAFAGGPVAPLRLLADPPAPSALLLGWRAETADVLAGIARAAPADLPVFVLAPLDEADTVRSTLRDAAGPLHVVPVAVATPWVRDYGPLFAAGPGGVVFVDAAYAANRPDDDAVPRALAARWFASRVDLPLELEGGNLVTDGRGRCFSTLRLVERNPGRSEAEIGALLRDRLGCTRFQVLPRLRAEPTGHVDMMVGFVGDVALVAASDDPRDGPLLDDIAAIVANDAGADGREPTAAPHVVRVPLTRDRAGDVLSWVQVISLGDRLLYPDYAASTAPPRVAAAQATAAESLARAFPGRRILPVRLTPRAALGGGLHCYTLGLP